MLEIPAKSGNTNSFGWSRITPTLSFVSVQPVLRWSKKPTPFDRVPDTMADARRTGAYS